MSHFISHLFFFDTISGIKLECYLHTITNMKIISVYICNEITMCLVDKVTKQNLIPEYPLSTDLCMLFGFIYLIQHIVTHYIVFHLLVQKVFLFSSY